VIKLTRIKIAMKLAANLNLPVFIWTPDNIILLYNFFLLMGIIFNLNERDIKIYLINYISQKKL